MTHALVTAIVPKPKDGETFSIEEKLFEMMAPYDESKSVEPYQEECWCVDTAKRIKARELTKEHFGYGQEHIRDVLLPAELEKRDVKRLELTNDEPPSQEEVSAYYDARGAAWRELSTDYFRYQDEVFASLSLEPDADCGSCSGTGMRTSTYNPQSKWDYYVPLVAAGLMVAGADRWPEAAERIPGEYVTYSLLTPGEGWLSQGDLGWFGVSANEQEDWGEKFLAAVKKYDPEDFAIVICDYHI